MTCFSFSDIYLPHCFFYVPVYKVPFHPKDNITAGQTLNLGVEKIMDNFYERLLSFLSDLASICLLFICEIKMLTGLTVDSICVLEYC